MHKNQAAKELINFINLYSDYLQTGSMEKHDDVEFNFSESGPLVHSSNTVETKKEKIRHEVFIDIREKRKRIIELSETILSCRNCALCSDAKKVTGSGNVNAEIFVIADTPTPADESASKPLAGEDGQFFKKWLGAIDILIDDVFITNILKCGPGRNKITKDIVESCRMHLDAQLDLIGPKIILTLGQLPASSLRKAHYDLNVNHAKIFEYNGYPVISTFDPAVVLKNTALKKLVWNDLNVLKKILKEQK